MRKMKLFSDMGYKPASEISLTQKSCDLTYVGYYAGYSVQVLCSLRNRVFSYLITG